MALESLGYVTSRSGALLVADFGLFGAWAGNSPANAIRAALSQGPPSSTSSPSHMRQTLDFDEAGALTRCGLVLVTDQAQQNVRAVKG